MRNSFRVALAAAGTIVLAGAFASPALAATDGSTDATVTVTGGELSITVPATVALSDAAPGGTASGTVANTTVTDTRAGTDGWNVSYTVLAFSNTDLGESIPLANLTATPGSASATSGVGIFAAAAPTIGQGSGAIFGATGVHGNNSATWDTSLALTIPADGLAGVYSTTFIQSVTTDAVG
ncbi:MAG: hypothetical protein JWQ64_3410 [Subtercola sp.]|jgi:hypothetical protein|nr:hypothetical protein [Subtercola sp.]